jgi:hypothetical protein
MSCSKGMLSAIGRVIPMLFEADRPGDAIAY